MSTTLATPAFAHGYLAKAGVADSYWSQAQAYDTCQAVRETLAAAKSHTSQPSAGLPYSHRWRKHTHEWIKAAPTA